MTILLSAAELAKFAKVGGLADIAYALPLGWEMCGHSPIIVLPYYRAIKQEKNHQIEDIKLQLIIHSLKVHVHKSQLPNSSIPVFLVECDELYDRDGIYGNPDGFQDNDLRFYVLCKAAFEIMIALGISPDIISAHDYHTALMLPLLKNEYAHHPLFIHTKGVLTIHNAQYQGWYENQRMIEISDWDLSHSEADSPFLLHGSFNALKAGIEFADAIVAVSPGYAQEIKTKEFGEGLEDVFLRIKSKLSGILNGVDYQTWDPQHDSYIPFHFSPLDTSGKLHGKARLLSNCFGNDVEHSTLPLLGMVSRFTDQKGIELLEDSLEVFLQKKKCKLIVLGSGEDQYQKYFQKLQMNFPDTCCYTQGYDEQLAHNILAYSDFFLMPSRFEPCGLTQLYAMRYGTVPIVRYVGGLKDTVHDIDSQKNIGDGIVFEDFTSKACHDAIERALYTYQNTQSMNIARQHAMQADFSIEHTAEAYIQLFKKLLS